MIEARASLVLSQAWEPTTAPGAMALIPDVLAAASSFWRAAPWRIFDGDHPILATVTLPGEKPREQEVSILGNAGEVFGLALYRKPGSIERFNEKENLRDANSIGLTLDATPTRALRPMVEACGLPLVPTPMKISSGRITRITTAELGLVCATLRAASALGEGNRSARGVHHHGGGSTTVTLEAPPPAH